MSTQRFSIWLVPPSEYYGRYAEIINRLADQYGSPKFEPHFTLLGGLKLPEREALKGTKYLAQKTAVIPIELLDIGYTGEYFRSLFVRAKERQELFEANRLARQTFETEAAARFSPHLSLVYGRFSEATKRRMIDDITEDLTCGFEVSTLRLMWTPECVAEWSKVADIELQ